MVHNGRLGNDFMLLAQGVEISELAALPMLPKESELDFQGYTVFPLLGIYTTSQVIVDRRREQLTSRICSC